jgi:hypothetical protein
MAEDIRYGEIGPVNEIELIIYGSAPRWFILAQDGINEAKMQFVLGVFLFVVVVGLVDLRVPWPKARNLGPRS